MRLVRFVLTVYLLQGLVLAQVETELACLDCHQSGTWFPLSIQPKFQHNSNTNFELRDGHTGLKCTSCHSGASIELFHQFTVNGLDCANCHQDIHQNYWGNQCDACHTPENWDIAQTYRRHEQTLFPLFAGHQSQDCYLCHTSPRMMPPLECQACHQVDFIPDLGAHSGLTENADCSTCHAPTRWDQILAINHDAFFPIYSGEHRGEWNSCSTCHTQPSDYQTFTCFGSGCHSVSGMNSEHCEDGSCESCDGLNYPRTGVESDDCYFCHPQGNERKCGD
ncbi:MAG: hypothetical protein HON27_05825 [Candidatus Marinimicrobia bacterium]|jgi:hypothetical protein|nr:hypothetical protein [Candidatus Neomarinimicrobiota bacterium]